MSSKPVSNSDFLRILPNQKWLLLVLCILLPLIIGGIAGGVTTSNIPTWYAQLQKPSFNPPNWIFGPVWTLLYICMGISSFLLLRAPNSLNRKHALQLYFVQLVFNFFWSILFFGLHAPGLAFVCIALLLASILLLIRNAFGVDRAAGWLLVPYVLWVSFATALNVAIWMLN